MTTLTNEYREPRDIYKIAMDREGANIKELLQEAIIELNDPEWIYMFAKDVRANVEKLEQAIIKTGDEYWINQFKDNEWINKNKNIQAQENKSSELSM